MATLVFSALGTIFGGPLGGAIGALAGRQVDAAIIGGSSRDGPRLKELAVSTSSYGTPIPLQFGTMRVAGSIIWATDLVEHSERSGGGKGRPSVTTYSYSASFAVAVSGRPIKRIGRIWADGNLLRGASGDLKAGGSLRVYTGEHDQRADPLIMAAEGADRCPAFRGLAYAVFEDLDLSDFFNRIPTLTFEVTADDGEIMVQTLLDSALHQATAATPLIGIAGLSMETNLAETLGLLDPIFDFDCNAAGETLTLHPASLTGPALAAGDAAVTAGEDGFGRQTGVQRRRNAPPDAPPQILRYYDIDRDYQPGLQRMPGRPVAGQPATIELPVAAHAAEARRLAERMARRSTWRGETINRRSATLDAHIAPGSLVTLPEAEGLWRVTEWEWNASGVELMVERIPGGGATGGPVQTDPGRLNPPPDLTAGPTVLAAFELPWDGSGSAQNRLLFAAVSSPEAGWPGAALYADPGDGQLQSLGVSGRRRAVIGSAESTLGVALPHLHDRQNSVDVRLVAADLMLRDATPEELAQGANRVLLGAEIIQFCRAERLEADLWRLTGLLRGRGGTEQATVGHVAGERFILLDEALVALDPDQSFQTPAAIAAIGRVEPEPIYSPVALRGISLRPLSPVHSRVQVMPDGSLQMGWTRRARGGWLWLDGVETPLNEQAESYQVSYGPADAPLAYWEVSAPSMTISAATAAQLNALSPGQALHVRQRGSHAVSGATFLVNLAA